MKTPHRDATHHCHLDENQRCRGCDAVIEVSVPVCGCAVVCAAVKYMAWLPTMGTGCVERAMRSQTCQKRTQCKVRRVTVNMAAAPLADGVGTSKAIKYSTDLRAPSCRRPHGQHVLVSGTDKSRYVVRAVQHALREV